MSYHSYDVGESYSSEDYWEEVESESIDEGLVYYSDDDEHVFEGDIDEMNELLKKQEEYLEEIYQHKDDKKKSDDSTKKEFNRFNDKRKKVLEEIESLEDRIKFASRKLGNKKYKDAELEVELLEDALEQKRKQLSYIEEQTSRDNDPKRANIRKVTAREFVPDPSDENQLQNAIDYWGECIDEYERASKEIMGLYRWNANFLLEDLKEGDIDGAEIRWSMFRENKYMADLRFVDEVISEVYDIPRENGLFLESPFEIIKQKHSEGFVPDFRKVVTDKVPGYSQVEYYFGRRKKAQEAFLRNKRLLEVLKSKPNSPKTKLPEDKGDPTNQREGHHDTYNKDGEVIGRSGYMDLENPWEIYEELVNGHYVYKNVDTEYESIIEGVNKAIGLQKDLDKRKGLKNLLKELKKLKDREKETPGTLRAVVGKYYMADFKSEIGDGIGQAVHHFDGYNWDEENRVNLNNLILLSEEIHNEFHELYGKGNNTIEQFLEFLLEYHPEDVKGFMERYMEEYGDIKSILDKLKKASKTWSRSTKRKQADRYHKLPGLDNFNDTDYSIEDIELDKIPYDFFFLRNMEVPVGDGKPNQLATSDPVILDVYDSFARAEAEKFKGKTDDELKSILVARRIVEGQYGLAKLPEFNYETGSFDEFDDYSRDRLLRELNSSLNIGRAHLMERVNGKDIGFLEESRNGKAYADLLNNIGVGDGQYAGKKINSEKDLGYGLIEVLNNLKEFFEKREDIFDFEEGNPLADWDPSGDISPNSANVRILRTLFEEGGIDVLLGKVITNLPLEDKGRVGSTNERIRLFNEEYFNAEKPDSNATAFRNAKNDLSYLFGLSKSEFSTHTINKFFTDRGTRKPLENLYVARAFGFNPGPAREGELIDAQLADAYEAMGHDITVSHGRLIIRTRDLQKEIGGDGEFIDYLNPESTTEVQGERRGKTLWDKYLEGFKGFQRSLRGKNKDERVSAWRELIKNTLEYEFQNSPLYERKDFETRRNILNRSSSMVSERELEKIFRDEFSLMGKVGGLAKDTNELEGRGGTKSGGRVSDCCQVLLQEMKQINKTVENVGKLLSDTLDKFEKGIFGKLIHGWGSGGKNKGSESRDTEFFNRNYYGKFRVPELEELRDSTKHEDIKEFAERALEKANVYNSQGFFGYERDLDLVYAAFGDLDLNNMSEKDITDLEAGHVRVKEAIKNTITQKALDEELERIDKELKGLKSNEIGNKKEIDKLEARRKRFSEKEVIGEDRAKHLELLNSAYKKALKGALPLDTYDDQLSKLIKSISGVKKYRGKETSLWNTAERVGKRLRNFGVDTSDVVVEHVDTIDKIIANSKKKLGKTESGYEQAQIQRRIEKLEELRTSLLETVPPEYSRDKEFETMFPSVERPAITPEYFARGSGSFFNSINGVKDMWRGEMDRIMWATEFLYEKLEHPNLSEKGRLETLGKIEELRSQYDEYAYYLNYDNISQIYQPDEETNARWEKYTDHLSDEIQRRSIHDPLFDAYADEFLRVGVDDDPTSMFSKESLTFQRFERLYSRYNILKEQINQKRDFLPDAPEEAIEEYDNLVEELKKFYEQLDKISSKSFIHPSVKEEIENLRHEFEELSKSSEKVIGEDRWRRANEASGSRYEDKVAQENFESLKTLFGGDFTNRHTFNTGVGEEVKIEPQPKPEKEPIEGRLTKISYNFRMAAQSAEKFNGVLTKLFSIVGSGNALNDMITASSIRQTNEIMLASRRGMDEAKKLYNSIQMLVVELPGNDAFLTNLLTMLGTMDASLNESDLRYIGGVTADYYMAAQAKGQFNNETERELRNYLMTGQTRNLTNSVIASEVESLKNLNTVKERTMALEKALQKTGMDSIAHYDSYTNTLEEFKGRFQKSFADLGDLYLGLLKAGMDFYNWLDRMTNSALSQITIVLAVTTMGAIGLIAIGAELFSIGANLIDAFQGTIKFLENTNTTLNGLAGAYRELMALIAYNIGIINAETASHYINTEAKTMNNLATIVGIDLTYADIVAKIKSIYTNITDTITKYMNAYASYTEADAMGRTILVTMEGNEYRRIARIVILKETLARQYHTLTIWVENGMLKEQLKIKAQEKREKIIGIALDKLEVAWDYAKAGAKWTLNIATKALNASIRIFRFLISPVGLIILGIVTAVFLLVEAFKALGQAFGWWTNLGEMFEAIKAGIGRVWEAFMNSKPVQEIIKTFQNLAYTIGALFNWIGGIAGNIWQTIFGVDDGTTNGVWDIVGAFLEIVGAIGNLIYWISPIQEILWLIDSIGSAIGYLLVTWNEFTETEAFQSVLKGFQDVRLMIGEVQAIFAEAFEEGWSALEEIWNAFTSIFSQDDVEEGFNVLLEILKVIARIISLTLIPALKGVAAVFKVIALGVRTVASVVKGIADAFSIFIGLFTNPEQYVGAFVDMIKNLARFVVEEFIGIPGQIIDSIGSGVLGAIGLGNLANPNGANLDSQKHLARNYVHNASNKSTIINNNFEKGSVQADARNMTAKDVQQLFVGAFGYNKARGTKGVLS